MPDIKDAVEGLNTCGRKLPCHLCPYQEHRSDGKCRDMLYADCGSAIYNAKAGGDRFDGAAFDQSVVDAFSELDVGVMAPGDHDVGAFVLTNKFFVLTSAADGEWGWSNAKKGHFFTQWLTAGVKTKGKMPADTSKNAYLTLDELYNYTSKKANKTWIRNIEDGRRYKQHIQVYPANSGFELFHRK